ncbi:Thioredoxin H4-2 [Apostasia shenzhenica]|uniref:Thioredoxin H4-2 n=1 Tax=Apostasia shenzhenica TaxID=1088818 RepID=A0A2I0A8I7_9ASPA|nr:Thioredoxin H4-2 [Apostasia shenzhenica]
MTTSPRFSSLFPISAILLFFVGRNRASSNRSSKKNWIIPLVGIGPKSFNGCAGKNIAAANTDVVNFTFGYAHIIADIDDWDEKLPEANKLKGIVRASFLTFKHIYVILQ